MNIKTMAQKAHLLGAIKAMGMGIELLQKQQAVLQKQLEEIEEGEQT